MIAEDGEGALPDLDAAGHGPELVDGPGIGGDQQKGDGGYGERHDAPHQQRFRQQAQASMGGFPGRAQDDEAEDPHRDGGGGNGGARERQQEDEDRHRQAQARAGLQQERGDGATQAERVQPEGRLQGHEHGQHAADLIRIEALFGAGEAAYGGGKRGVDGLQQRAQYR